MKMPPNIDPRLLAPCGMNCMVCYRHCAHPKPCEGCRAGDAGKPAHCRSCGIRECAAGRGISHCAACPIYPCKRIRALEKSYRTRYAASLLENGACAREFGLAELMERQRTRFTCPLCGGVISLHDAVCSECRAAAPWAPGNFRTR